MASTANRQKVIDNAINKHIINVVETNGFPGRFAFSAIENHNLTCGQSALYLWTRVPPFVSTTMAAGEGHFAMKTLHEWRGRVYHANNGDGFYDSPEWRKMRRECFYRDGYRCLRCDKRFKVEELSAHHMMPRSEGGIDEPSNLVSLCSPCHDFVEVSDFRTAADIIGSYEKSQKVEQPKYENPKPLTDIDAKRPEWHKYVYGGKKRRR